MRPAAAARLKTLAALESARATIDLRLRPGDERRQTVDAGVIGGHGLGLRLRLRLKLRLWAMIALAGVFAGRMLVAWLIGLAVALVVARIIVARIIVARHEGLRLRRHEAWLLAEIRKVFAFIIAVFRGHFIFGARLRLVLAELFLGGGNQPEIVLGMLIVILRGHRIA